MKWMIWTISGLVAALWTGTLALTAFVVDRTAGALLETGPGEARAPSFSTDLPQWLSAWVEPGAWATAANAVQQSLQAILPVLGTATSWLEPLLWVLWVLGMLFLLAVAAGLHWWVTPLAAKVRLKLSSPEDTAT
jgi:hypothetical protein